MSNKNKDTEVIRIKEHTISKAIDSAIKDLQEYQACRKLIYDIFYGDCEDWDLKEDD